MSAGSIDSKVRELLALILDTAIPAGVSVSRTTEPKWNSLKHVELVFALEDAFTIRFSETEMLELTSIDAITAILDKRRVAS